MAENILKREDVFSQLQQIFPSHSPVDIDNVIMRQSGGHNVFPLFIINQCIDCLMNIKPRISLSDDGNENKDKDELSALQRQIIMELSQMFPNKSESHITKTVINPKNLNVPYPVLLQRCLDVLLEDDNEDQKTSNASKGNEMQMIGNEIDELDKKMQHGSGSTGCVKNNSFGKTEYREPNMHFHSDEDSFLFGDFEKSESSSGIPVATAEGSKSNSTQTVTLTTDQSQNRDKPSKAKVITNSHKEDEKTLTQNTPNTNADVGRNKKFDTNATSVSVGDRDFKQTEKEGQLKADMLYTGNIEGCPKSVVRRITPVNETLESNKNTMKLDSLFQCELPLSDTYRFYRENNSPEPTNSSDKSSSGDTPPHVEYCRDRFGVKNKTDGSNDDTKKCQEIGNSLINTKESIMDPMNINRHTPVKLTITSDLNSGFKIATPKLLSPQSLSAGSSNLQKGNSFKDYRDHSSMVSPISDTNKYSNKVHTISSSPDNDVTFHPSTPSREKYKCFLDNDNNRIKAVIQLDGSSASNSPAESLNGRTVDKERNNSFDSRSSVNGRGALNSSKNDHKRKYMLMDLSSDSDSDEQSGLQSHLLEEKDNDEELPTISIKTKDRDRLIMSPVRKWQQQRKQNSQTSKSSFSHYRDKEIQPTEERAFHVDSMPQRLPNTRFVAVGDASRSPQRPGTQMLDHTTPQKNFPSLGINNSQSSSPDTENKPATVLIESTCKITYLPDLFGNNKDNGIKQVPAVSIPSLIPHIPVLNDVPNVTQITGNMNYYPAANIHMASGASQPTETKVWTGANHQRQSDSFITHEERFRNLHGDPLYQGGNNKNVNPSSLSPTIPSHTTKSSVLSMPTTSQTSTVQNARSRINKSIPKPAIASTSTIAEAEPSTSKQEIVKNTNTNAVRDRKTIVDKDNPLGIGNDVAEAASIVSDYTEMDLDSDSDQDVLLDDELEVLGVEREVEVLDNIEWNGDEFPHENPDARQSRQPGQKEQKTVETRTQQEIINDLKNEVLQLFPDVEPGYLERLCNSHHGPMASNNICAILLDNQYPRKPEDEGASGSTTSNSSEDQAVVDYFTHNQYKSMTQYGPEYYSYRNQSEAVLISNFPLISVVEIRKVASICEHSYAMTYLALQSVLKQAMAIVNKDNEAGKNTKLSALKFNAQVEKESKSISVSIKLLKNRRYSGQLPKISPALKREVDFVERRIKEMATEHDHEFAKQLNEQEYEAQGQCIECGCCYGEIPFDYMVQCLDGHLFCEECLRQYARESVFGQGKAQLSCMTDGCTSAFPKNQLEKALPSDVLLRYEDRVTEENLNLADIGDLVRCPHCDFAAIMDPDDKVFRCMNEKCKKETCRHCKENWSEHFGKKCEEIEKKDEVKLRLEYEEKMTKAKVRTCHRCKAQFTKEDGCNKMTCRCGAKMCYICRKPDIDYNHFCRHPRDPGKACTKCDVCSLWTNPEEDDNRAVSEIQKEAAEVRKTKGYTEDKVIGVPEGPPAKKMKK